MEINKRIGEAAVKARIQSGMTQADAARKLGVGSVHLCRVEKGKSGVSLALLSRMREIYGVDVYVQAAEE